MASSEEGKPNNLADQSYTVDTEKQVIELFVFAL